MKKLISALFFLTLLACSTSQSEYENVISKFLEINKQGVRTDLQIKFEPITISDITVQDSIDIITTEFETKKAERISSIEASIKRYEDRISGYKAKNDITSQIMVKDQGKLLKLERESLTRAKNSTSDLLRKYENQEPSKIIAKKANTSFSVMNSKLQTRQTYNNAVFILSADGTTCLSLHLPDFGK